MESSSLSKVHELYVFDGRSIHPFRSLRFSVVVSVFAHFESYLTSLALTLAAVGVYTCTIR